MPEDRETRKQLLLSAVEQFLDHLEEDFGPGCENEADFLGSVVIAAETHMLPDEDGEVATIPTHWCSNENGIWCRGFFEILTDYFRVNV